MTLQLTVPTSGLDSRTDKWPLGTDSRRTDKWPLGTDSRRTDKWPLTGLYG